MISCLDLQNNDITQVPPQLGNVSTLRYNDHMLVRVCIPLIDIQESTVKWKSISPA